MAINYNNIPGEAVWTTRGNISQAQDREEDIGNPYDRALTSGKIQDKDELPLGHVRQQPTPGLHLAPKYLTPLRHLIAQGLYLRRQLTNRRPDLSAYCAQRAARSRVSQLADGFGHLAL